MKESRKQKREAEKRLLAEFDEALAQERGEALPQSGGLESAGGSAKDRSQTAKCMRCHSPMEGGVCPVCGYKVYQPMSEEKRKKIRWIIGVVCIGIFLVLFLLLQKK